MAKPDKKEYPEFYQTYINALEVDDTLLNHLESSLKYFEEVLLDIALSKQEYRYAEGKWTIKEIVQHLIDTERVFIYRALRYSRKDSGSLLSFDENSFVTNYQINKRNFDDMLNEFTLLRRSTIFMFQDFDEEIMGRQSWSVKYFRQGNRVYLQRTRNAPFKGYQRAIYYELTPYGLILNIARLLLIRCKF